MSSDIKFSGPYTMRVFLIAPNANLGLRNCDQQSIYWLYCVYLWGTARVSGRKTLPQDELSAKKKTHHS